MNVVSTHIQVLLVFFSGKSLKICSRSISIFRDLTCDFFLIQCISIVERKVNSIIKQQNCEGQEKRDRLLTS